MSFNRNETVEDVLVLEMRQFKVVTLEYKNKKVDLISSHLIHIEYYKHNKKK